jgi:SLT domain-containing protein
MSGFGNIYSALDNLISSERYISREYGSPGNIPGLLSGKYVGYDSGGWLDPGLTVAVNKTGVQEPTAVFTPSQWSTLQALASGGGAPSPINITLTVGNQDIMDLVDARVEHYDAVVTRSLARGVKLR